MREFGDIVILKVGIRYIYSNKKRGISGEATKLETGSSEI